MKIAIVIPVYRTPNRWEKISIRQCCKVLGQYDHYLIAPDNLDTSAFQSLWAEYGLSLYEERFAPKYFKGPNEYNQLCLSREYYIHFLAEGYSHILIYQPDAFIFKDDLSKWCSKGYEYIGAPNVGKARQNVYSPAMPMRVGNGGFSLRSIPAFMRFFDGQKPVFNLWHVLTSPLIRKPNYWWIVAKALKLRFTGNTPTEVLAHWQGNEDDFWGCLLALSEYALSRPVPEEALQFAFDRFPRELYARTGHLPMGCHAWHKYEYEEFWKPIIDKA